MDAPPPINRLTEREKEVLRAWLNHKSAKEIALDLGITHHAVEKRLKMARTKLDAGSSLEAARMLAEAEGASAGYSQAVTTAPDLAPAPPQGPSRRYRPIVIGGITMSLALVLALALATGEQPARDLAPRGKPVEVAIDSNLEPIFNQLDENGSGYLESPESPFVTLAFINPDYPDDGPGTAVLGDGTDPAQVSEFYGVADTDMDDRVSFREYYIWSRNQLAAMGIDTRMILKPVPATTGLTALVPATSRSYPAGMRAASPCETNAFMRAAFASFDGDGSKSLDPAEAGALEPRDGARDRAVGPAPAVGQPDPAAEAKWIALLDRDGSRTVSEPEYKTYMLPWMLLNGVPQGWRAPEADAC